MDIAIYTFCIMYSPGPVNLLAFNNGLHRRLRSVVGYCVGVGLAMFSVFLVLGYAGAAVVRDTLMPYIAAAGSAYIAYLAYRLYRAPPRIEPSDAQSNPVNTGLGFWQGYLLQLLNPKGMVVTLPVTTLMFPAAHVDGIGIAVCAGLISIGAIGAPLSYAWLGAVAGQRLASPRIVGIFNKTMAILLLGVAGSIVYDFFISDVLATTAAP